LRLVAGGIGAVAVCTVTRGDKRASWRTHAW
jgi:hypothetical protein